MPSNAPTPSTAPMPSPVPIPSTAAIPSNAPSDLMLAYGTLRVGVPAYDGAALPERETFRAGVRVPGRLVDLGAYPGAVIDLAAIRGERPVTQTFVADVVRFGLDRPVGVALADFDAYEEVDPAAAPNIYRRIAVPLAALDGVPADLADAWAWIYEWLGPTEGRPEVPGGDWLAR